MALQILSDMDAWTAAAYAPDGENPGMVVLRPEAEAFIVYGSISIGMGELNEATAPEWLARLRAWEAVYEGSLITRPDGTDVPVTMDALRPFFGTRVNVFPQESSAKFTRRVGDALMRRMREKKD